MIEVDRSHKKSKDNNDNTSVIIIFKPTVKLQGYGHKFEEICRLGYGKDFPPIIFNQKKINSTPQTASLDLIS